jgi:hypothetical protein
VDVGAELPLAAGGRVLLDAELHLAIGADANPTFPTGLLILEFCRKKASPINARWAANACSEDLPSFRILVCA